LSGSPSSPPDLRSEELAQSWRELRAAGEEAESLTADLSPVQLRWRPSPERWSIAECLEHLVLTGEAYLDAIDAAVEEGRRSGRVGGGSYRRSLVGRWLMRLLEPPPGVKVPAPPMIRPQDPEAESAGAPGGASGSEGDPLSAFLALRPRFAERLAAADGLDLARVRLSSPFFALIRFDLGSAFRLVTAHERRHLWQARRVREAEDFPEAGG